MRSFILGAVVAAVSAGAAAAQVAVGPQVGTTGIGVEAEFQVSPAVTVRGGGDWFSYDQDFDTDDFTYAGEMDFSTLSAFLDLHPFGNAFFVSGGAYFGDRSVDVRATAAQNQVIGGQILTPADFGQLVGEADFGGFAPFVGLGWNNTFRTNGPWGFKAVLGATFGEEPSVDLRREGGVALPAPIQAQFDIEREQEERDLEDEIDSLRILPVLQVGVTYRFGSR